MKNRTDLNLGEVFYIAKSDIIFNCCHFFFYLSAEVLGETTGNQVTHVMLNVVTLA